MRLVNEGEIREVDVLVEGMKPVLLHPVDDAVIDTLDELGQMSVEVNSFVGDVRFDEQDVQSLINLWDEYSEIGEDEYEAEEGIDFESMLNDDRYLQWAESYNLEAEDWARKTVRITMMIYREQMLEAARIMPEQMAQQIAMPQPTAAEQELLDQYRAELMMLMESDDEDDYYGDDEYYDDEEDYNEDDY